MISHDQLSQSRAIGLFHRFPQQRECFLASFIRSEIVRPFIKDRIDLAQVDELENIKSGTGLRFYRFQIGVFNEDILIFLELITFNELGSFNNPFALRTVILQIDTPAAFVVKQIE